MNAGIDYGLGRTNIDRATGIRYGVISSRTIGEAWYENSEADYGDPTCPQCGETIGYSSDAPDFPDSVEPDWFTGKDFVCFTCEACYWSDDAFGDDPIGHHFEDADYTLTDCLDSDVMIIRSPYYTYAQFCSPCVPGAGNLDTPIADGVKTYCLSHDWFETDTAPYPVYRVSDNSLVQPEA